MSCSFPSGICIYIHIQKDPSININNNKTTADMIYAAAASPPALFIMMLARTMYYRLSLCAARVVAASSSVLQLSSSAAAVVEFIKTTFFSIPQPVARLRLATLLSMVALRQGLLADSFSFLQLATDSCTLANDCEYYYDV